MSSSSQKSLVNGPSSIYQTSRCSMTVARNVRQPLPRFGAVQLILISFLDVSLVCVTTLPQISLTNELSGLSLNVPCLSSTKSFEFVFFCFRIKIKRNVIISEGKKRHDVLIFEEKNGISY